MDILITERPSENGYIASLINAYTEAGATVTCDASNFFYSNGVPDILHIHWPENLYKWNPPAEKKEADILKVIEERLTWFKHKGTRIIHTIHNLQPHDSALELDMQAYSLIIKHADILVHHCHKSISLLVDRQPEAAQKQNIVAPHGDYLIHFNKIDQNRARNIYGIPEDKIVILNLGRQRPYKNQNFISSTFRKLCIDSKYLFTAGVFEYPQSGRITKLLLRLRNKIRQSLKFANKRYIYRSLSVSQMSEIISCADIIFLGQTHVLNSGILAMAATYGKPVVCPDTGCFREAVASWCHELYRPGDQASAVKALQLMHNKIRELREESGSLDNSTWLADNSWDKHVNIILAHALSSTDNENTDTISRTQ